MKERRQRSTRIKEKDVNEEQTRRNEDKKNNCGTRMKRERGAVTKRRKGNRRNKKRQKGNGMTQGRNKEGKRKPRRMERR